MSCHLFSQRAVNARYAHRSMDEGERGVAPESFNFVYASTLEDVNTVSQFTGVISSHPARCSWLRYDYGVIISDCYYG